jgi:hypothetical protein
MDIFLKRISEFHGNGIMARNNLWERKKVKGKDK